MRLNPRNEAFDVPLACDPTKIKVTVYDYEMQDKVTLLGRGKIDVSR